MAVNSSANQAANTCNQNCHAKDSLAQLYQPSAKTIQLKEAATHPRGIVAA
jgi:hypothetical protein